MRYFAKKAVIIPFERIVYLLKIALPKFEKVSNNYVTDLKGE